MIEERKAWRSKFGFYIASVGTAFGLGNLWRFPYVVSDYGGGAFVFLYVLMALFIGIPLAISEISLGKFLYKKGITLNQLIEQKSEKSSWFIQFTLWLPMLISFIVLSYYSVISGWTLHMIIKSVSGLALDMPFHGESIFLSLKENTLQQILLLSVHLLFVFVIIVRGLKVGVEKWLSFVMPFFVMYLVYICFEFLTKADLFSAAKYMIYPNFHMLTPKSFSYALGHLLFTMSLGFSALVTLGVYLPQKTSSGAASSRIALVDTGVSIFIGFVIFPIVLLSGYNGQMSEALFRAFPIFIESQSMSLVFSLGFYVCIFIAAINSSLSLVETILYRLIDTFKWSRLKASRILLFLTFLGSSFITFIHKNNKSEGGFIELVDDVFINHLLPLSAICLSVLALRYVDKEFLRKEFENPDQLKTVNLYKFWRVFIFYIMPSIYLVSLLLRL